jgi:hypothetical protein
MTDQAVINPVPAGTSPETTAAYRQVLARHFNGAQVDRALGPANATPAPTTRAPLTSDIAGKVTVSATESSSAAAYLETAAAKGMLTGEAKAMYEKMKSNAPKTAVVPSKADPFVPGATPEDYKLNWPYRMRTEGDAGELQSRDTETRTAFATGQVPLSHAQPLLDALNEAASLIAGKSTGELEMHDEEITRQVATILGDPEVAFAKAASVAKSFGPKAYERLKASGAFRSVQAVVLLNSVADAIQYRKGQSR